MKKILSSVLVAIFLVVSFGQASYASSHRNYDRQYSQQKHQTRHYQPRQYRKAPLHHSNGRDVAVVLGVLAAGLTLGAIASSTRQQPVVYQNPVQSQTEYRRELQHQQAEAAYQDCLSQKEVDIRYGVHPQNAKDCTRLDPQFRNWSR